MKHGASGSLGLACSVVFLQLAGCFFWSGLFLKRLVSAGSGKVHGPAAFGATLNRVACWAQLARIATLGTQHPLEGLWLLIERPWRAGQQAGA